MLQGLGTIQVQSAFPLKLQVLPLPPSPVIAHLSRVENPLLPIQGELHIHSTTLLPPDVNSESSMLCKNIEQLAGFLNNSLDPRSEETACGGLSPLLLQNKL